MEKISVYGAGVMGSGEATLITGNGLPCTVIGRSERGMERCRQTIEQNWDDLITQGLAETENKAAAMKLLTITNDPAAMKGSTFVFEAVAENVKQKGEVYQQIEQYAESDVIIASCTSSLNSEDLAATVTKPENLLIVHPLNPTHMIPLVEVVANAKNTAKTMERTKAVLKLLHRQPVTLNRSMPGILVNRLHQAIYRESIYLIEQGVTTAEDINLAFKYLSMRYASIGVLEFFDDVGMELESSISKIVYPSLCKTTELQNYVDQCMKEGKTGKKAGMGLLDWSQIDEEDYRYRKQSAFFSTVKEWNMPK